MSEELETVQDLETKRIIERVVSLNDMTQLDLPVKSGKALSGIKLEQWLDKKETAAACNIIERGIGYLIKKKELGHGQFGAWIVDQGALPRAVQEAIKSAQMLVSLSDSNARRAAHLPAHKIATLAIAPIPAIENLFDSGALNDVDDMNREQLREIVRLQKDVEKLKTDKEKSDLELAVLKRKKHEPEGFTYPESVERVRIESAVLATQANQCLDDMEQFMIELTHATDLNPDKQKQEAEFSAGASTLYVNLKSIYAKSSYLLGWFEKTLGGDYMPEADIDTPLLDEQEAMQVHNMQSVMLAQHKVEKILREGMRQTKRRKNKKAKK